MAYRTTVFQGRNIFFVDSHLGTQLTRQPPRSSSKGNLFVRVRFGGVPSTVEEVVPYGSVACLIERPTWDTYADQYLDTVLKQSPRSCYKALSSRDEATVSLVGPPFKLSNCQSHSPGLNSDRSAGCL